MTGIPGNTVNLGIAKPPTTITTTINLGSVNRQSARETCVITPTTSSQSVSSKITQVGITQPRVITLPSSSSMSATTVSATTVPGSASQNTPNARSSESSITSTNIPSTNIVPKSVQQATLKSINNPHSIGPVKVLAAPTGSIMQPVQMTVSAAVASSGQTGHTVILKKAGKIETFPVPSSNSATNALISLTETSKESVSATPVIPRNIGENSGNNGNEPVKVIVPKLTYSNMEGVKKNSTQFQSSVLCGSNPKFSNGTIVRQNLIKPVAGIRNSEPGLESIASNKTLPSNGNLVHASPDSTSNSEFSSVDSVRSTTTNSIQNNTPHNSFTKVATTHPTDVNCEVSAKLSNTENIEAKVGLIGSGIRNAQDSSVNSSFDHVSQGGFESQLENSSSSGSGLKRTVSSTANHERQYVNCTANEVTSCNTANTLDHQQEPSEAKKQKI